MLPLLSAAALLLACDARVAKPTPAPVRTSGPGSRPARVAPPSVRLDASAASSAGRAELIDYQPVADPAATVTDSSGKARFTVLTVRASPPPLHLPVRLDAGKCHWQRAKGCKGAKRAPPDLKPFPSPPPLPPPPPPPLAPPPPPQTRTA